MLSGLGLLFSLVVPQVAWGQAAAGPAAPAPPPVAPPPAPAAAPAPAVEPSAVIEPAPAAGPAATAPAAESPLGEPKKKPKKDKREPEDGDAAASANDDPSARPEDGQRKRDKPGKADKRGKRALYGLELKGRIFALAEVSHRNETIVGSTGALEARDRNALDLSLQSARFGINYQSPLPFLSAQLELDIAGNPRVKDAFLLVGKRFFVKAGQFKVPSSTLELESPWTLPLVQRGLVHELMTDWLDIAGRRPGVAVGYHGKGGLKPRLTLGVFQGTTLEDVAPGERDVNLIDHASMTAQTYAARGELTLAPVTFGAWFEHRVGSTVPGEFSHFPTFGLDVELQQRFESGVLRAWVDGSGGESLYVNADKPGSDAHPWFVSGRALVGYRFGGLAEGDLYVEPFGFFALMDPDTEVVSDFVTETSLGVAAGFWDRLRITLQGEMTNGQRNFPTGFLDSQTPDHMSLLLQAGARF